MNTEKDIGINDFSIETENKNANLQLNIAEESDRHVVLKFTANFTEKTVPSSVKVSWKIPVGRIISIWSPLTRFSRFILPDWNPCKAASKTAIGAPVLSLINDDGSNACTIAISDSKTPTAITAGVSEEEAVFICKACFFESYISPIDHYEAYIYIDLAQILFADAVKQVNRWWETSFGYQKAAVPRDAYLPMDSAWYSFHQELDSQALLEQCKLSAKLGMKTIIIDDGWQTDDNHRGYKYCGDWKVATGKISCMRTLVDEIHRLGMKVILWYSVPFVGVCSDTYEKFKDKALLESADGVLTVDIRYKEVRDYLVDTYVTAVRNFGLDGLKLDFIDRFDLKDTSPQVNEQMDISSVEDALEALLSQIKTELVKINPEILLEFRQSYMGPTVLKYGNMVRVRDCPYDSLRNRVGIIDLRLTSGITAVHSDMVMWSKDAPVEAVARQLISTLFGVPQISVRLSEMPKEHLDILRFWLDFYIKNMDILHSDEIYIKNPEMSYSQVKTCKNGSSIGVNYANVPYEISELSEDCEKHIIINSSGEANAMIRALQELGAYKVQIFDCSGNIVQETCHHFHVGISMFDVPVCGFMKITK